MQPRKSFRVDRKSSFSEGERVGTQAFHGGKCNQHWTEWESLVLEEDKWTLWIPLFGNKIPKILLPEQG